MIFPYDRNDGFSDASTPRPTQRPASNSEGRKRAHPSEIRPKGGLSDPHTDNGFAEVIRKAQERAWDEGWNRAILAHRVGCGWVVASNPYGEAS